MHKIYLCAVATFFALGCFAQGKIELPEKTHDFGRIAEEGGIVTYTFKYINRSDEGVFIERIVAPCGCTSSEWTTEVIMPGDTGHFTVGYNPLSREGEIDRTATIYLVSDSQKFSETVFLKGYVNPRVRSIDEQFPYSLGTILCSRKMIFFGKVFMGGVSKEFLNCYNNSDNEVVLQLIGGSEFKPTNILTLSPKERGQFEIEYNTTKGDYGVNTSTFKMVTNGDTLTTPLLVRAEVQEDFSKLSIKQQQKAPIYNSKPTWNLGKVEQGEQIIVDIPISNLGFSPLIIRKIETGSFYLIPTFKKNKIKSGKVGTISITVDAERLDVGPYKRTITIITNDPKQSEVRQKVSFEVVKKKE